MEPDFPITVARAAPVLHRFPEHQGQTTLVARTDRHNPDRSGHPPAHPPSTRTGQARWPVRRAPGTVEGMAADDSPRYEDLSAVYVNCTLKRSPETSNTEGLIARSRAVMESAGARTSLIRAVDHDIATGVWPDMTDHGWESDQWPVLYSQIMDADILVLCGPIWLGDNSSVMKQVIERLYACSSLLNEQGQYAYYGRVGGALITGNEDGVKHCAMNILYSLQHLGYAIPPQADAGWIGEAGPGPSYLDPGSGGPENDFTNRNTTFMSWNLMHLAALLKRAGGMPAHGNQRSLWDAGCRFDFPNPEHR